MTDVQLGYTIFYVDDVAATLRFFVEAFGLEQKMLTPEGDYGELDTGKTTLAFASTDLASANLEAAGGFTKLEADTPPPAASITLVTGDIEPVMRDALDAGATLYVDPVDKPWGQTVAYLRDPNGILVEIATPVG